MLRILTSFAMMFCIVVLAITATFAYGVAVLAASLLHPMLGVAVLISVPFLISWSADRPRSRRSFKPRRYQRG